MNNQRGVGLIEVLIAVLVLAIGLLGLAGLQSQSLKFNNESYFRTQATLLSMDMADRLRTNRTYARTNTTAYTLATTDTPSGSSTACETSACSPSELAQYDFKQWRDRVEQALPGGTVKLTPISTSSTAIWQDYTIEVSYQASDGATTQTFTYRVRI